MLTNTGLYFTEQTDNNNDEEADEEEEVNVSIYCTYIFISYMFAVLPKKSMYLLLPSFPVTDDCS